MPSVEEPLQIGVLSERTGVNIETIRYYERIRLLTAPRRSPGGYRRYGMDDVRQLSFIRRLRGLGFALEDVRALIDLAQTKRTACAEVRGLAARHLREVQDKIKDLRRMERVLRDMVASCDRGVTPRCPMIETLYRAPDGAIARRA
jgi:MerR family mercuric resistance operon transcriptional regulator